jgi:hypothetical protein
MGQEKKIYGYKQVMISGVQPVLKENGTEKRTKFNYLIYFSVPKSGTTNITSVWISGKNYNLRTEPVITLPVYKIYNSETTGNDSLKLVPFTKNKVLLIIPRREDTNTPAISNYLTGLVNNYELVISYTWKGKKYYSVLKKITELKPEARM